MVTTKNSSIQRISRHGELLFGLFVGEVMLDDKVVHAALLLCLAVLKPYGHPITYC